MSKEISPRTSGNEPVVRIQRSADEFVLDYFNNQPHKDVKVLEDLFAAVEPTRRAKSDFTTLPIETSYNKVPVSIKRLNGHRDVSKIDKADVDPILHKDLGDIFYIFIGGSSANEPFAILPSHSSEWATYASDGVMEALSDENKLIVSRILQEASNETIRVARMRQYEQEDRKRRREYWLLGLGSAAVIAAIAGGIKGYFYYHDTQDRNAAEAFDANWGDKFIPVKGVSAETKAVHDVPLIPLVPSLVDAPASFDDEPSSKPRKAEIEVKLGGCSVVSGLEIDPNDVVYSAQMEYNNVPIGMSINHLEDSLTFCSYKPSESRYADITYVVYQVDRK